MSFFDGEACPDDNLKGILSIHLKLGKYIHSIKILVKIGQEMAENFPNKENTKMLISRKPC